MDSCGNYQESCGNHLKKNEKNKNFVDPLQLINYRVFLFISTMSQSVRACDASQFCEFRGLANVQITRDDMYGKRDRTLAITDKELGGLLSTKYYTEYMLLSSRSPKASSERESKRVEDNYLAKIYLLMSNAEEETNPPEIADMLWLDSSVDRVLEYRV